MSYAADQYFKIGFALWLPPNTHGRDRRTKDGFLNKRGILKVLPDAIQAS